MKRPFWSLEVPSVLVLVLLLAGCSTPREKSLFDTAPVQYEQHTPVFKDPPK